MKAALALVALLPLVACSDDVPTDPIDAAIDTPTDTLPGCGADVVFTGEYVQWTSTTADFRGIFEARFTIANAPTQTALTAPNGRITLCLQAGPAVRITATQAAYTPAVFLADPAVFTPPGSTFTARGLALASRDGNYDALMAGMTFDPLRAHVLVEKRGTAIAFALGASTSFAYNADAWAAGDTGELVLFPNVAVGSGTATLTATGGSFVGPTQIELVAGQLTVVPLR